MEGHGVLRTLDVDPGRVVRSRNMNRPDMEHNHRGDHEGQQVMQREEAVERGIVGRIAAAEPGLDRRSDEHTSELQSLMRISYAVFCLQKKPVLISRSYSTCW